MYAGKLLASLIYIFSCLDYAAARGGYEATARCAYWGDDAHCDGTLAVPCNARSSKHAVGTTVELAYMQPTHFTANGTDGCKYLGGPEDCEYYAKTIFVKVTAAGDDQTDFTLTQYGMSHLCHRMCKTMDEYPDGVCQVPEENFDGGGCRLPLYEWDICNGEVPLKGNLIAHVWEKDAGRCGPVGTPAGSLPCTFDEPCEVKVRPEIGAVGDLLKINYTQPISNGGRDNWGDYCNGEGDSACEAYTEVIHAWVVEGEPQMSGIELDRAGLEKICQGACLEIPGGSFTGVCQFNPGQAPVTECKYPAESTNEICGVNLVGSFQYEVIEIPSTGEPGRTANPGLTPEPAPTDGEDEESEPTEGEDDEPTEGEDDEPTQGDDEPTQGDDEPTQGDDEPTQGEDEDPTTEAGEEDNPTVAAPTISESGAATVVVGLTLMGVAAVA